VPLSIPAIGRNSARARNACFSRQELLLAIAEARRRRLCRAGTGLVTINPKGDLELQPQFDVAARSLGSVALLRGK
jgi:ABC-type phosphonate transport system ATPase subunit